MHLFLRLALILVLVYVGVLLLLAGFQNRLLYFPTTAPLAELRDAARRQGLEPWKNAQGETIGWHLPNPTARRRLVVFHGNAGHALHRTYYALGFSQFDYDVYLFEYPGYGARAGAAGKAAFLATGRAAINELLAADPRPIVLLGESIGSGTACALAAELPDRIAGLALVVPIARLAEVASRHFTYVPINLILRDRFDNIASLAQYRGPVAFVVAQNDEVVSAAQGFKLHASYPGSKHLITLPDYGHNNFPTYPAASWWGEVARFLASKQ